MGEGGVGGCEGGSIGVMASGEEKGMEGGDVVGGIGMDQGSECGG